MENKRKFPQVSFFEFLSPTFPGLFSVRCDGSSKTPRSPPPAPGQRLVHTAPDRMANLNKSNALISGTAIHYFYYQMRTQIGGH